jgi:zinc protease
LENRRPALTRPAFTDEEVALARQRTLTALAQEEDDADAWLGRLATENVYGAHPFSINPAGTRDRIAAVKAADLEKWHRDTVSRSRLLLVVVGNVTREELTTQIRSGMKDLPRGDFHLAALPPIPAADRTTTRVVARDLPTVYIEGLFPAPNPAAPDFAALFAGMSILSNHYFEELRTKRNLSYAPDAWTYERGANLGAIYISTPKPNEALPVMAEEIRKMQNAAVSEEELRNTANVVRTQILQGLQASADIADWLGRFETRGGGWEKVDAFLAKLATVTPEEVRQAMKTHAHNIDFAVLGNVEGIDAKLLTGF